MRKVRLTQPSFFFLSFGIVLFLFTTISVIDFNVGGTIEKVFWFTDGMLAFCLLTQIGMRFANECLCDVNVATGETEDKK